MVQLSKQLGLVVLAWVCTTALSSGEGRDLGQGHHLVAGPDKGHGLD